jgi:hypothetical protein
MPAENIVCRIVDINASLDFMYSLNMLSAKTWELRDDDCVEVGEKIAEGAQGEICAMRILGEREHGEVDMDSWTVLKVFKQGWSLQNLQK